MRLQPLGHLSGENLLRNELALRRLFHPPKRLKVPVETLFRHWIELSLDSMGESCQPQLVRARQKQSVIGKRLRNTFGAEVWKNIQHSRIRIKNKGSGRLHWRGRRNKGRSGRRSGASSSCSRVGMSIRRNGGWCGRHRRNLGVVHDVVIQAVERQF